MDLSYLKELGYSEKEIKDYSTHWCEGHIAYLADQKENVFVNMKYLQPYFNKELLLKFPVYYIDSFSMEPDLFEKRIDKIREAFPDEWTDMIEKQFYGYSGIAGSNYKPILQLLGSLNNSDFTAALDQLSHPETIVFEFMVLLKDKLGIDVAAENFENWILELEMCKYEVLRNAEWLIADGLPADFVEELLYQAPYLMMLSKMEFKKIFISEFGENYIAKIQKMDTDEFLEKIGETTW